MSTSISDHEFPTDDANAFRIWSGAAAGPRRNDDAAS